MTPALLKVLNKIYHYSNSAWDPAVNCSRFAIPDGIGADMIQALADVDMAPNSFEHYRHDETLSDLLSLQNDPRVTLGMGTRFFIAGLAGRVMEGRQVMLDVLRIKAMVPHEFVGTHGCEICGLEPEKTVDVTQVRLSSLRGHASNEVIDSVLPRITGILSQTPPEVFQEDLNRLFAILDVVEQAAPDETPSKLLNRIGQSKLIPKSDKYKREGLMQTLAELGILPNDRLAPLCDGPRTQRQLWEASRGMKGSARSDIALPFAAWRGRNGVNRAKAETILGALV